MKCAPLKAIVPVSQMFKPVDHGISKIGNTSNPSQRADNSYKTLTSMQRMSIYPGVGIPTPSSKVLDISLSSSALTSTQSKPP
ncbi:uncharacterized protein LOC143247191 isoform X4 [Tachypleus tridentatus]|uniref:uncharacterized protein LOC143247191 isoform X4 n=1 Tax=Tachypleus tridentatus TaxID=6853 RepID=UPI003FD61FAD